MQKPIKIGRNTNQCHGGHRNLNKKEKTECPKKTIKEHVPQSRGTPVKRYTRRKKPGIRQQ